MIVYLYLSNCTLGYSCALCLCGFADDVSACCSDRVRDAYVSVCVCVCLCVCVCVCLCMD